MISSVFESNSIHELLSATHSFSLSLAAMTWLRRRLDLRSGIVSSVALKCFAAALLILQAGSDVSRAGDLPPQGVSDPTHPAPFLGASAVLLERPVGAGIPLLARLFLVLEWAVET